MKRYDLIVIGAGPAGLSAATEAAKHGLHPLVLDENEKPGGQLFKQMNFTGDDINLLPKIMVFVVVEDDQIEEILADIATAIGTGKNGDGKVFVTEVLDAMRIRTNERGDDALM